MVASEREECHPKGKPMQPGRHLHHDGGDDDDGDAGDDDDHPGDAGDDFL